MHRDDTVDVAVCQLAPVLGDVEGNVSRAVAAVREAVRGGASVVVLPELVTTGYVFADVAEVEAVAEASSGPSVSAFVEVAASCAREHGRAVVVVGGFAERDESGVLRNSAFVVDATGLRAVYRKVHLWDRERSLFVPGTAPPPVVETDVGRIGVCVCYDLEFPEWTRTVGLAGADLLCAPTNWPAVPRPAGERPVEVVRAQATASVDRMFVAVCDRVGRERGVDWVGGSAVVDPSGYPLALAVQDGTVQTLVASCRLSDAREKGTSAVNGVVADRRPELYSALTGPVG